MGSAFCKHQLLAKQPTFFITDFYFEQSFDGQAAIRCVFDFCTLSASFFKQIL